MFSEAAVITVAITAITAAITVAPYHWEFPGGSVAKKPPADAEGTRVEDLIPGSRRSPGGQNGDPSQYSCQENSMNRRVWWSTVHGVTESGTAKHECK